MGVHYTWENMAVHQKYKALVDHLLSKDYAREITS